MKLLNKKTGEIGELQTTEKHYAVVVGNGTANCNVKVYCSLAKLNENWEDYEEPKEYWYIDINGEIMSDNVEDDTVKVMREVGNYFDTREQAEQAVEKLKAWKRLKDIGYNFDGWFVKSASSNGDYLLISLYIKDCTGCEELLDLLFGGEE